MKVGKKQMSNNKINIDLGIYESKLRREIGSDLNSLQITYDAISQSDYGTRKYNLKQEFTHSELSVPPSDFLIQREINKCFKSIIGSLQDYMDNLIAILRLKKEPLTINAKMTNEDVNLLLQTKFKEHLINVSADRSLNIPKKIILLLDKSVHQIYIDALQSYFDVRNGLEHHKGVATIDRVVKYQRLGLITSKGSEIVLPQIFEGGESILLKTFDEEIKYDKGGELILTRDQLDSIVLNLLIFVIPTLQKATAKKFNNSN
jgi:hypothetical protein